MCITCRYNTASNANKVPIVNIGSSSALNNLELTRKGSVCENQSYLVNDLPKQSSNVGSNNIDMGSTTHNAFAKAAVDKNKSAASSTVRSLHPSSIFQPIKNDLLSATQKVVFGKAGDVTTTAGLAQARGTHHELQMQHPSNHYDQHHHLIHGMQQQQQPPEHDDLSLKKLASDAPHCGSSNVLGGLVEGNAANYSVNGSASGSNHGSNGPNGSSNAVNTVGTNMESDNGIGGKSGSGDVSGSRSGSGSGSGTGTGSKADQSKSAHREAALTKFRQKRKERCFQKKVAYIELFNNILGSQFLLKNLQATSTSCHIFLTCTSRHLPTVWELVAPLCLFVFVLTLGADKLQDLKSNFS